MKTKTCPVPKGTCGRGWWRGIRKQPPERSCFCVQSPALGAVDWPFSQGPCSHVWWWWPSAVSVIWLIIWVSAKCWVRQKSSFTFSTTYRYLMRFPLLSGPCHVRTPCCLSARGGRERLAPCEQTPAHSCRDGQWALTSLESEVWQPRPLSKEEGPTLPELTFYRRTAAREGASQGWVWAFVSPICAKQSEHLDNTSWLISSWFTHLFDLPKISPSGLAEYLFTELVSVSLFYICDNVDVSVYFPAFACGFSAVVMKCAIADVL